MEIIRDLSEFAQVYDHSKQQYGSVLSNDTGDLSRWRHVFGQQEHLCLRQGSSLFLLEPRHDFFEVSYFTPSAAVLTADLRACVGHPLVRRRLRLRQIITAESDFAGWDAVLSAAGFKLQGRLIRYEYKKARPGMLETMREIVSALPADFRAGLGRPEDAAPLSELLSEEFDQVVDSVPTLEEIAANIRKKGVFVLKNGGGEIISAHYLEQHGAIVWGLYDITRKAYRKLFPIYAIRVFMHDYFKEHPRHISRTYGWYRLDKKRLHKNAEDTLEATRDKLQLCIYATEDDREIQP